MTTSKPRSSIRTLACPKCRASVRIPIIWILGIESVFTCPKCRLRFKTGFKTGAVLFALALTAAVATANLGAYVFSSYSVPLMALLVVPLWILYGYTLRRLWMLRKAKRLAAKQ